MIGGKHLPRLFKLSERSYTRGKNYIYNQIVPYRLYVSRRKNIIIIIIIIIIIQMGNANAPS